MIDNKRLNLLIETAESMGLSPELVTDYGLVALKVGERELYVFHKSSNPNGHIPSWLSKNKYIARLIFKRHGLKNIPFCLPKDLDEAKQFLGKYKKIIVKPNAGEHSADIHVVSDVVQLEKVEIEGRILEEYIKGQEIRYLVVRGEVKAVHKKMYSGEVNDPETVRRVSLTKENWDNSLVDIAVKAANIIGLVFTAVDFMVTENGEAYLLEINSAPGIDRFQVPDEGPSVDIMRLFLEELVRASESSI